MPAQTGKTVLGRKARDRFEPREPGAPCVEPEGRITSSAVAFGLLQGPGGMAGRNRRFRHSLEDRPPTGKSLLVDRATKKELVATLNGLFKSTNVVVVAHYSGLNVAQMQVLRKQMKQAGAAVKGAKKRLAKNALEGTDAGGIRAPLQSAHLIAHSRAPAAPPQGRSD